MKAKWSDFVCLCLLGLLMEGCSVVGTSNKSTQQITVDQKIAYYRSRIGGAGTYPRLARLGLAYLEKYRETGNVDYSDKGLRCLRQSLSYQHNFEALLGLATGLSERHHFKEALPYAEEAVAALPSDIEAAGALFDIRLALGQDQVAEKAIEPLLAKASSFQLFCRLSALREYRGDVSGALAAMIQARDDTRNPKTTSVSAWTEVRIGSLQMALCEPSAARSAYVRALAIAPDYPFAQEHLAEWHAASGQWVEAASYFRQLLRSRPKPQYRIGLAEALREQGRVREAQLQRASAVADLRRSAARGEQDPFRLLALLLLQDEPTAAEGLDWARRDWEVRQDALAADTLAWAYYCNGNQQEAVRFGSESRKSGAIAPVILMHSGLILSRESPPGQGIELLQRALACTMAFGPQERALVGLAQQAVRNH